MESGRASGQSLNTCHTARNPTIIDSILCVFFQVLSKPIKMHMLLTEPQSSHQLGPSLMDKPGDTERDSRGMF